MPKQTTMSKLSAYIRKLTEGERRYLCQTNEAYKKYRWIVTQDYKAVFKDHEIIVPRGFLSDGCTGGNDKWGIHDWLVHDWLYYSGGYLRLHEREWKFVGGPLSRTECDSIFKGRFIHRRLVAHAFGKKYFSSHESAPIRVLRDDFFAPVPLIETPRRLSQQQLQG